MRELAKETTQRIDWARMAVMEARFALERGNLSEVKKALGYAARHLDAIADCDCPH
jgi:hypothetical protein